MRGATSGIPAFSIPSIPIHSKKSRRLSEVSNRSDAEEETPVVEDGSQKVPSVTDEADMQRADDASARGSVPDELNEPKHPGDASRSKEKGKVDTLDNKTHKKRISAKAKADLESGRIPTFRISGTCEVLPSEAPAAQSLGVIPPTSLPVNSDSTAIPPCLAIQTTVNVSQTPPRASSLTRLPRLASKLSSESSLSKRRRSCQWTFSHVDSVMPFCNVAPHHKATLISLIGGVGVNLPNPDSLSIFELLFFDWASDIINVINTDNRIVSAYEAEVQRREDRIKTLASRSDVDAARQKVGRQMCRADSWGATTSENQQSLNDLFDQTFALKEERQRLQDEVKKIDVHLDAASAEKAGLRANLEKSRFTENRLRKERDEARHRADEIASGKEVKAQLCYRREARMSLEKMVEAEYELPPALLENYVKEEKEYLVKVKSFDSLGDDTLFPTPPPPSAGLPRDVASQVPKGINEHGSFLSLQDNQDGDKV
ncbi:hypothetical protein AALP_AA4G050500 [Arabis alpina]|uniref:Uncharacterized protein n=1 Tax=Arabis alpina TaxID=50452 RepID=A0A087H194_ARAAL|nr:hypothetical protein AALP_AA4G050500 [Arabis alpina]